MSKRLNGGSVGVEMDERAAKRRKLPTDNNNSNQETVETTTQRGLELLEIVKRTADKSGRLIATDFLTLPNKRLLPDYYKFTKMPIALDTIESKLKNRDFATLSLLESYFKRMVTNAKEYNSKGSRVHEDAERLRKAISNYMTKHNPAYKTHGYVAFPTPLPEENGTSGEDAEGEEGVEAESDSKSKNKRSRPHHNNSTPARRLSATPAATESKSSSIGFNGLTFQQAQEKIVDQLMQKKEFEQDDFPEFLPFLDLPSRKDYKDYYELIQHPMALKDLRKLVKGVRGKAAATGISELKSWPAFEQEVSYIWKNAFQYNEDDSDFYKLAKEFQKYFTQILHEAKSTIPEPTGTKIKLRMPEPTKITLKFGGKPSPAESPAPQASPSTTAKTNGTATAAVNGTARRISFSNQQSSTTPVPTDQLEHAVRSTSDSVPSPTPSNSATIKNEDNQNSPAVQAVHNNYRAPSQTASTPGLPGTVMPPPTAPSTLTQSGFAHSFPSQQSSVALNPPYDTKFRQPGKDASDALITNLSIVTHSGLNIPRHFRLDIPPSATLAQQSITVSLPASHYYIQIKPTISASLFETKRQHKLFVTSGTQRLNAMIVPPSNTIDQRHPVFQARLDTGVNKIEVELIAALPKSATKVSNGQDVELEKITIFANLVRS